jgi:outer membrane lipoprotein-sorting protein
MRTSPRWIVPIAVAGTIVGGVAVSTAQAGSAPSVPDRTAQQVLASVAGAHVTSMSGTVVTRTDLGLPSISLPNGGHGGNTSTDPQALITRFLTGQNTLRVWTDGATKQRVQLLDSFDELDVVRNGSQVWTYSAGANEVGTGTLPTDGAHAKTTPVPSPADLTPAQMADRAIAAAAPTTAVTLGTPELVAGRAAYALTLTPKTDATLVDRVVIAVDAEKGVPLQVEVFARGHNKPAIETGFTAVDFSRPSAATFTFTPPKGAKVTKLTDAGSDARSGTTPAKPSAPSEGKGTRSTGTDAGARPTVTGTGWASIVEFPASADNPTVGGTAHSGGTAPSGDAASAGDAASVLGQLTKPVDGGRAFSSRLLSVLMTTDGRVLVGAVPVDALVAAAKR